MNLFYTIIRGIVYLPFKIFYPAKVVDKHNMLKKTKLITVSNHLKWTDIGIVAVDIPGFRHIIAKKELGKNPIIRAFAKWLGIIFVDRGKTDLSAIRTSVKILKEGGGITIFPEGTRNKKDESLQEVKSGVAMFAIKGDAPIIPIIIHHRSKLFRRNYLYVAEPFDLDEFKGVILDTPTLEKAAKIVTEKMLTAKSFLDDYVANKRWIERKEKKKQHKAFLKTIKKQSKVAVKNTKKEIKKITQQFKKGKKVS